MNTNDDRDLGLSRPITRRDFLNGAAVAVGAIGGSALAQQTEELEPFRAQGITQQDPRYYPPGLTGMRGSHPGSFDAAHDVRDHKGWTGSDAADTGEVYDLVVVGAGLSGLAAAHFFRKANGARSRILLLDNHDDFGGHAKRNEFKHGNRLLIGYGGTEQIYPNPAAYSADALALIKEIGVDTDRFYTAFDRNLYKSYGLERGIFFDKETFGTDRLVLGEGRPSWPEFLAKTPLSAAARADLARLYDEKRDCMPGLSPAEKRSKLSRMSYNDYLLKVVEVSPDVIPFFQTRPNRIWARGTDVLPAIAAWEYFEFPGFDGLGLELSPEEKRHREIEEKAPADIFHFPDGNASLARLLVRSLIPSAVPGKDMEDVVTSRVNYPRLDRADSPVRIRLNSTVVHVKHLGDPGTAKQVDVTYVREGKAHRIKSSCCVMAGYNMMIPYICPELPQAQREAMKFGVKSPLVYTNVLISNWRAWQKLGVHHIIALNGYHTEAKLDFPVSLGSYKFSNTPEQPMVLHLEKTPLKPGVPVRDQWKMGRAELLETSFKTFERAIRDQLARMLGPGGFDPARDIEAITVNRWPHGYAGNRDQLSDPEWSETENPWAIARKPFGRITIANSDSQPSALTQAAIDQALRAVRELQHA